MSPRILSKKILLAALFISTLLLISARDASAQGKQAIVVTRSASASVSECEGAADLNYYVVTDLKINNKDEIRLFAGASGAPNASMIVTRDAYEDTTKTKIRDLSLVAWGRDGLLYATGGGSSSRVLTVPAEMKPDKREAPPLSSFYGATLTGEAREGKQKRRITLQLREVWKIYLTAEGAQANDTLFRHAADEKSIALWEAYLAKTGNYRQAEANNFMRDALISCARSDLERFAGGDYGALDRARKRTDRAQSVKSDEQTTRLTLDIKQAQERVDRTRANVRDLIAASRYDEAITAAEPIKIYLDTWPDLNEMYADALQKSHNQHLFKGREAFDAGRLEDSREECTTAWGRVPASAEARACVCKARNEIAFRDQKNFRQRKMPKNAKETIERQLADSDCARDERLVANLREANCEYAQQLLSEARQLTATGGGGAVAAAQRNGGGGATASGGRRRVGRAAAQGERATAPAVSTAQPAIGAISLKSIMAQNKKDFREARARLTLAAQLCPEEAVRNMLEAVNRRLTEYCVVEAQKALQQNNDGTAYVYLTTAQTYTPADAQVSSLLAEARERFQNRARVQIGVVLNGGAGGRGAEQLLAEIASEIESAASGAGLEQPVVLDRGQAAESLRAIQAGRALNTPTIIFFGDLVSARANRTDSPRRVRSSFNYENPYWKEADRIHDARNEELKRCRKQQGANCYYLESEVANLKAARDRHQRTITEYYEYHENHIRVTGDLRLSFRATDSISRSTREADVLTSSVNRECVERQGTRREDYSARDSHCDIGDEFSYMRQMLDEVKMDAQRRARSHLSELPLSYHMRAQRAVNRQQAVEDYLRFLFLTSAKDEMRAQEARKFLIAFDPELETDGVMR